MKNNLSIHLAVIGFALFLAGINTSCSSDTKAAATKVEITLDPNLYTVEHPELFQVATVEHAICPLYSMPMAALHPT